MQQGRGRGRPLPRAPAVACHGPGSAQPLYILSAADGATHAAGCDKGGGGVRGGARDARHRRPRPNGAPQPKSVKRHSSTYGVRDSACPLSTRGGTRLVRLVRGRGGGGTTASRFTGCHGGSVRDSAAAGGRAVGVPAERGGGGGGEREAARAHARAEPQDPVVAQDPPGAPMSRAARGFCSKCRTPCAGARANRKATRPAARRAAAARSALQRRRG